jgi:aspartyl-tRNA(Asn)/glutamyl-tRNA(Gln) amidotransferase subunit A
MAHRVEDVARLLDMIAGFDACDPWSRQASQHERRAWRSLPVKGLRMGVPGGWFRDGLHPDMSDLLRRGARSAEPTWHRNCRGRSRRRGDGAGDGRETGFDRCLCLPPGTACAEAGGFGPISCCGSISVPAPPAPTMPTRCNGSSAGGIGCARVFAQVDIIITPTTPGPAPLIEQCGSAPELMRTIARNTYAWSAWNGPSLSVPCGFCREGMPLGMQVTGRPFDEATVFALGHAYQQATDHHMRHPRDIDANWLAKSDGGG